MNTNRKLNEFLGESKQEVCTVDGKCYVKDEKGNLIEVKRINKTIITEDGRQLLKEELPVSNSSKNYLT